jgi:hypothetical protein
MVRAALASKASAPAPLSARHFLIGCAPIKNAGNSPENNALDFSNGTRYLLKISSHRLRGLSTDSRYSSRFPLTALIACCTRCPSSILRVFQRN